MWCYCMQRKVEHEVNEDWVCDSCLTGSDSMLTESGKKDAPDSFQEDEVVTRAMSNEQFSGIRGTRLPAFKEPKGGKTKDVSLHDHSNVQEGDHPNFPPTWKTMDQPDDHHTDDEIIEDEQDDDILSDDSNTQKKKKNRPSRGVVRLSKILADKIKGIKRHLKFNEKGKSIGTPNRELQCYLGMQAKTMVPITIDHWRHVPAVTLDDLWKDVNQAFYLNEGMRKEVLSSVSIKWRQLKANLNRKFIAPYMEKPELLEANPNALEKPPSRYSGITEKDWKQFVSNRTTKEFQEYRKKQQARRAGVKYPHRSSRHSYNEIEVDLQSKLGTNESIDRSILWKEARKDSTGNYRTEHDKITGDAIDNLLEKRKAGTLVENGTNDILTQVLGSPEHPGRVRGQSQGVRQRDYFLKPTGGLREVQQQQFKFEQHHQMFLQNIDKLHESFNEKLKSHKVERQKERDVFLAKFAELSSQIASLKENSSSQSPTSMPTTSPIYETPPPMERVKEFCVPTMNIETTKPCNRAKMNKMNISSPIAPMTQEKTHPSKQLPSQVEGVSSKCSAPMIFKIPNELPKYLRILLRSVKYMDPGLIFQILMDADIFGHPHILCISQEDVVHFGLMEKIGVTCISFYIRVLYLELVNKEKNHLFGFIQPSFSSNVGAIEVEQGRLISTRMANSTPGQVWLLPYHLVYHWTLIIIDKDHQTCYFLNTLGNPPPDNLKLLMSIVFDKNGGAKWRTIKCPHQSSMVECGFYVLRLMKDFVTNGAPFRWLNSHCGENKSYTLEEINEVREDWAQNLIEWMP
ncbi:uncharacterized protein LOC133829664 isoform X2 [Humulus lupulus]|uniref:uncharacterized protein LOC133829664 isoform X2 n=1 Tax=Humulus lupulus TaxID=3486 RepID=UPI002B40EE63|nr:uncharacterized protein LOC133829664 isoform X2 [Humulus lupulus]